MPQCLSVALPRVPNFMKNNIIVLLFFIGIIVTPLFSVRAAEVTSVLLISTFNVDADFTITGPKTFTKADAVSKGIVESNDYGLRFMWEIKQLLPPGTYTIVPAKVNGYYVQTAQNESPNQTFTVPSDQADFYLTAGIHYAPTKIKVKAYGLPSDTSVSFNITGPTTYQGKIKGGDEGIWMVEKVPHGTYTLVWDGVPGYEKLDPETITIAYFASTIDENLKMKIYGIDGYFTKKQQATPTPSSVQLIAPVPLSASKTYCDGTVFGISQKPGINVGSNSSRATFYIEGPGTLFNGEGDVWSKENVPPGEYTIAWGNIEGCEKPLSQTKTLKSGSLISFVGIYTPKGIKQQPPQAPALKKEIIPASREPSKEIAPYLESVSKQKSVNGAPPQQIPLKLQRNLFFRIWEDVSSFFRRVF